MNASSESGECASLISTGSFSVFWIAGRPAMSFVYFLGDLPAASEDTFPSRWVRRELEEESPLRWDLRGALPGLFFAAKA